MATRSEPSTKYCPKDGLNLNLKNQIKNRRNESNATANAASVDGI